MYEDSEADIVSRVEETFSDEVYLKRASESRQRWLDEDLHEIANGIVEFLKAL